MRKFPCALLRSTSLPRLFTLATSADGTKLIGVTGSFENAHYTSKEAGATWENTFETGGDAGGGFFGCASSADGAHLVVSGFDDTGDSDTRLVGIWTSADA